MNPTKTPSESEPPGGIGQGLMRRREFSYSQDFKQNHLLDPKTGITPAELSSVSIAATTTSQANTLSAAVFVDGPEDGMELVRSIPDADALFLTDKGRIERATGFPFTR